MKPPIATTSHTTSSGSLALGVNCLVASSSLLRALAENWWLVLMRGRGVAARGWLAAFGIGSIVAGRLTLFWSGMTTLLLLLFIAAWSTAFGMLPIWGAIQMRQDTKTSGCLP